MSSINLPTWDSPGGPVVKTLPSIAGGIGLIPGQGTTVLHAARHGQFFFFFNLLTCCHFPITFGKTPLR